MANATFSLREMQAKYGTKYNICLNLEGWKTERAGGYDKKEVIKKAQGLLAEYNKDPEAFKAKSGLKGTGLEAIVGKFGERPVDADTNALHEGHVRYFIDAYNIVSLDKISAEKLKQLKKDMKTAGLSDSYISIRLRSIRCFLRWCLDKRFLKVDPWPTSSKQKEGGSPLIPSYKSKGYYFPDNELSLLLSLPVEPSEAQIALNWAIRLSLYQGWREELVWGFNWERVDLEKATYLLPEMKGAIETPVPLLPLTVELIRNFGEQKTVGRIFTRWGHPEAISLAFRRLRRACGLKRGRFHDIKHTSVSKMYEAGYSIKEISEFTNTSEAALQHYTHVNKQRLLKKLETYSPLPKVDLKIA